MIQEEGVEVDMDQPTPVAQPNIILNSQEQAKAKLLVQKLLDHDGTGAQPSPARSVKPLSKLSSDSSF